MFRFFARDGKEKIIRQIIRGRFSKEQNTYFSLPSSWRREALQMRLKPTGCYAFYQQLAEVTVKITPLFSRGGGGGKQQHSLKHCNTWDIWAVFHYCSFLTWAHISGMSGLLSTSAAREDVCSALNEPSSQHCWEKTRLPTSEVVKFNLLHISCCWNCPRSSSLTWVDIASLSDNTN